MPRVWRMRFWVSLLVVCIWVATVNAHPVSTWVAIVLAVIATHRAIRNEKDPMPGYFETYDPDE